MWLHVASLQCLDILVQALGKHCLVSYPTLVLVWNLLCTAQSKALVEKLGKDLSQLGGWRGTQPVWSALVLFCRWLVQHLGEPGAHSRPGYNPKLSFSDNATSPGP